MTDPGVVARGTLYTLIQAVISGVFRIGNIVILTRLLFPNQIGQVALLAIIYGYMQFLGALGLNHASPLVVPEIEQGIRTGTLRNYLKRCSLIKLRRRNHLKN